MKPISLAILVFVMSTISSSVNSVGPMKPASLRRGDTIAVVAPAKPGDPKIVEQVVEDLKRQGFRVKLASNLTQRVGYLAGSDKDRARAFMDCWLDPDVKALWCIAGGYGCTRLLPYLDFKALAARPKIFIGMSDITALHAALAKETGMVTYLGPTASHLFSDPGSDASYSRKWLWHTVAPSAHQQQLSHYTIDYPVQQAGNNLQPAALRPGLARGRLVGGNLALIASLVGTPWQIETRGKILLLEEVAEQPYRIDRMLCQLKMAGMLDEPAAVILCSWHNCRSSSPQNSLTLSQVFNDYFGDVPYPVLKGFPSGHILSQATVPLNCLAEVNADRHSLRILESPVLQGPSGR